MLEPGRKYEASSAYRFGYNGKEQDSLLGGGVGIDYNYGARINDVRIGRFLSIDPLITRYPYWSPYQFAGNTPIQAIDLDGLEPTKGYEEDLNQIFGPDLCVKKIHSDYDNQTLQGTVGDYTGPLTVSEVQDIDNKTYLVYEDVSGTRQWSQECDKDGYRGDVQEFQWKVPEDPGHELEYIFVAPILAVPLLPLVVEGAVAAAPTAGAAITNPYIQALIGGDAAGAYEYEYGASTQGNDVATQADAQSKGDDVSTPTTSPANTKAQPCEDKLDWSGTTGKKSESRIDHVNMHGQDNSNKDESWNFLRRPHSNHK